MTNLKKVSKKKPTCIGSGLVALDVILNGNPATPAKLCAGGSCGNVLSILSYLGWESKPVARLSKNNATKKIVSDFSKFNVSTDLLTKSIDGSTPIIIHRILKDKNNLPKHRFEFKIPQTNIWLPEFKPVLSSKVELITKKQINTQVYYFDRISRSSIDLAKYYKSNGALVVFEPSSYKESKQFMESLQVADIVKFSNDRINDYSKHFPEPIAPLEIETLGSKGLRYRLKSVNSKEWKNISPFIIDNVIDSAGAGDWCTAGIINQLGQTGIKSFLSTDRSTLENALNIGQALGAINSVFMGARGIMYYMNPDSLNKALSNLISKNELSILKADSTKKITTIKDFNCYMLL